MANNYNLTSLFFGTPPIPPVNSVPDKKNNLANTIIPLRLERIMQDTLSWRDAQEEAERAMLRAERAAKLVIGISGSAPAPVIAPPPIAPAPPPINTTTTSS